MGSIRHAFTAGNVDERKLLYCSYSKYEQDWNSNLHMHYFSELFYVTHGKGMFQVEERKFQIQKGDLILVNPNIAHTESSEKKEPLEYIVLGVDHLKFLIYDAREYLLFHSSELDENLDFYFQTILKEAEEKKKEYENVCEHLLAALILQLTRRTKTPVEVVDSETNGSRECSRVKRYIDASFAEELTLEQLAEIACLNKYYLAHQFSKMYGIAPMSYLQQKRIFASQELLSSTDLTLGEIARQCGYSSQSYFTQCFRKMCGMSPGMYRKINGSSRIKM